MPPTLPRYPPLTPCSLGGSRLVRSDVFGPSQPFPKRAHSPDLTGSLLKLDFTQKCTERPRSGFRRLTKVWSSESLPILGKFGASGKPHVAKKKNNLKLWMVKTTRAENGVSQQE